MSKNKTDRQEIATLEPRENNGQLLGSSKPNSSTVPKKSSRHVKLPRLPHAHARDVPHPSQGSSRVKFKELTDLQNALCARRECHEERLKAMKKQSEEIELRRASLEKVIHSITPYALDAAQRGRRALSRCYREKAEIRAKIFRIQELQWQLIRFRARKHRYRAALGRYRRLAETMNQLIGKDKPFPSIKAMIKRHHTLALTLRDMKIQKRASEESVRRLRAELQACREAKDSELLRLGARILQKHARLQEAMEETAREEQNMAQVMGEAASTSLSLGYIREAVLNIFRKLKVFHWGPSIQTLDAERQLDFVQYIVSTFMNRPEIFLKHFK